MEYAVDVAHVFVTALSNPITWIVLLGLVVIVIRKVMMDRRETARIAALPKLPRLPGVLDKTHAQACWLLFVGSIMYGRTLNTGCLRQLKELAVAHGADGSCIVNSTYWLMHEGYVLVHEGDIEVTEEFLKKFKGARVKWPDNTG